MLFMVRTSSSYDLTSGHETMSNIGKRYIFLVKVDTVLHIWYLITQNNESGELSQV